MRNCIYIYTLYIYHCHRNGRSENIKTNLMLTVHTLAEEYSDSLPFISTINTISMQ